MKTTNVQFIMQSIENLRGEYKDLRHLVADQIRDDQMDEAKQNLEKLERIKQSIEYMEQLEVILPPSPHQQLNE